MGNSTNTISKLLYGLLLAPVILLGLLSIVATGNDNGNDGDITPQGRTTVAGVVSGSGGLVDVNVSSGGKSATTDTNGFYELANIPIPAGGSIVVTYEKDGYATFQRSLSVADGETYAVAASLLQYHYNESMDAAQSNHLIIADPGNTTGSSLAEIAFPAGSVASSGNVTVEVAVGDPTTDAGRPTFPGDYMAASTLGGEIDTPLESVVFTEITVTDANGTELTQLNEPATVIVRLPDALQDQYSVGDTIPWWSYDEITATWVRQDAKPATTELDDAEVVDLNNDGVLYTRAEVTHFSWWNVDQPMNEHACLCVVVQDGNGAPVVGSQLVAEGVSYNGVSRPARTGEDGQACVTVKRSMDSVTERVKLYIESGGVKFYYDVTNASEGDVDSNEIFTPSAEGSTINNTGQCVDLANTIGQRFDGVVNGTVTKEGSGSPIADFTILSNFGPTATSNVSGQYSMNVPVGAPISLFAVGLVSQDVMVTRADTPATVNFVVPNQVPLITQFTRVPDGTVTGGQSVTLSVTATDPDGDGLSYVWSATAGSLNQATGSSVVWTAPVSGSGTAQVTVDVSDIDGGQTSQTVSIVYNEAVQTGDRLSFVIKDHMRSDQPVQGITVALYNTDNRTIKETKISDVNGVVDFGVIGRSRATFTIVYEDMAHRYIDTLVNMLVAENIVYYLDDDEVSYYNVDNPIAAVDLSLSNVPAGAVYTRFEPLQNLSVGGGALTNMPVGTVHLQNDGKLSLLALTYDDSSQTTLTDYGYLLDQTVTNGANYDVSLHRKPLNLGWTTSPVSLLRNLSISGMRGGVSYELPNDWAFQFQASSGSIPFANEFPVDYYRVDAWTGSSVSVLYSSTRHDTLAQSVQVSLPDYSMDSFDYADATRTLSWEITGSTPRDMITLNMESYGSTEQLTVWMVMLDENATDWQVIDLPAPANTWIDAMNPISDFTFNVSVCDMDFVNGWDQLWQFFISGNSFDEVSQQFYCGSRTLSPIAEIASVVGKASTSTQAQNVNVQGASGLLDRGLGHLRRR